MGIVKGHPISFADVAAIVAANYPEYTVQLDPTGTPLSLFGFPTGDYPPPADPEIFNAGEHIVIAMISPPNLTVRETSIDDGVNTYNLFIDGVDVTFSMRARTPFIAPNIWKQFDGTVSTDLSTSIGQVRAMNDAYVATHAGTISLGQLESTYVFFDVGPPPLNKYITIARAAFRTY